MKLALLYFFAICTYFKVMRITRILTVLSYRIETLNTVCYNVNYECIKYHVTEVGDLINKTKKSYVSHETLLHKNGVTSMITYAGSAPRASHPRPNRHLSARYAGTFLSFRLY